MGVMEIVLIVLGMVVFVLSFMLPAGKKNESDEDTKISEEAIKEILDKEMENVRSQISDIVDETITYAMEKTERGMDRLTNEKMMAVNEYSDTVLEEINKNHKEVVFLYDMLNDKHESLKNTVSEAVKTADNVKQTLKDAEVTAKEVKETVNEAVETTTKAQDEFVPFTPAKVEVVETVRETDVKEENNSEEEGVKEQEPEPPKKKTRKPRVPKASGKETTVSDVPKVEVDLSAVGKNSGRNSNERILQLHEAGKSNMAIAKELGLGIGEVKLVIDLFEGV